jgi:hypothetical protein
VCRLTPFVFSILSPEQIVWIRSDRTWIQASAASCERLESLQSEVGVESAEDAANFHVDKVRKSAVKDNMVVAIHEYLHGHSLLHYGYRSR